MDQQEVPIWMALMASAVVHLVGGYIAFAVHERRLPSPREYGWTLLWWALSWYARKAQGVSS